MKKTLIMAAAVVAFSAPAYAAAPDLIADFNTTTGTVTVKNDGTAPAGPSVVTIKCQRRKPPVVGGGGGCPEIPRTFMFNYTNPAFPNALSINVGALAPGAGQRLRFRAGSGARAIAPPPEHRGPVGIQEQAFSLHVELPDSGSWSLRFA